MKKNPIGGAKQMRIQRVSGPAAKGRSARTCKCGLYLGPTLADQCWSCQAKAESERAQVAKTAQETVRRVLNADVEAAMLPIINEPHRRRRCPGSSYAVRLIPGASHYDATCPFCERTFLLPYVKLPIHFLYTK